MHDAAPHSSAHARNSHTPFSYVIVDVSFLLHARFAEVAARLQLGTNGLAATTSSVISSVHEHLRAADPHVREVAENASAYLSHWQEHGILTVKNTSDNEFLGLLGLVRQRKRKAGECVVLSNDMSLRLAVELLQLKLHPAKRRSLHYGALHHSGVIRYSQTWYPPSQRPAILSRILRGRRAWVGSTTPFQKTDTSQPPSSDQPAFRDMVVNSTPQNLTTASGERIQLSRLIRAGAEGSVYCVKGDDTKVCKIYHTDCLTKNRLAKLRRMIVNPIQTPQLAWPEDLVFSDAASGVTIGFTMPFIRGVPLSHGLMLPVPFLEENPHWTRRDSVALAIDIVTLIGQLHALNVRVGDLNTNNILVDTDGRPRLIDCDSFQVEQLPSQVGRPEYSPPEMPYEPFDTFLRTMEHELFAVAVLVFKIMLPNLIPYARLGAGDIHEAMAKAKFPYRFRDKDNKNVPKGVWRYCWSHLSRMMKLQFLAAFHKREVVPIDKWLKALHQYERYLNDHRRVFRSPIRRLFDLNVLPRDLRHDDD